MVQLFLYLLEIQQAYKHAYQYTMAIVMKFVAIELTCLILLVILQILVPSNSTIKET